MRWVSDRSDSFLADYQGRDLVTQAALALDRDGHLLAMRCTQFANIGAHTVSFAPLSNGYRLVSTVYHVPTAWVGMQAVLTNTAPIAPYRGAGRPEATLVIERLLDLAAVRLGIDRIELRRRNLVAKERLPYRNVMGLTYDSGDFRANHGPRPGRGRLGRLCGAPRRQPRARQAARHRHRQLCRGPGRRRARTRDR